MSVSLTQWRHLAQSQPSVVGLPRVVVPTANATVFGAGSVGDKAAALYAVSPHLQSTAWRFGQQMVVASDVVDRFVRAAGIRGGLQHAGFDPTLAGQVRRAELTPELRKLFAYMPAHLSQRPVAVRSTAAGDAAGTGTYYSMFTHPTPQHLADGFRQVVASFFSDKAYAYRTKTGAAPELAVMVMPLTAQEVLSPSRKRRRDVAAWASMLSGWAVTKVAGGGPLVGMVPGLFHAVKDEDVAVVSIEDCANGMRFGTVKSQLFQKLARAQTSLEPEGPLIIKDLIGRTGYYGACVASDVLLDERLKRGLVIDHETFLALRAWRPQQLFDSVGQLSAVLGGEYYTEWALTVPERDQCHLWLNQIASKRIAHDSGVVPLTGALFDGTAVYGSGLRELTGLVHIFNANDLPALRAYNAANRNYGLIYDSRLASGYSDAGLNIAACSNAGALFCFGADAHGLRSPISHWGGALEEMDVWFGTIDRSQEDRMPWEETLLRRGGMSHRFEHYSNPVRHRFAVHDRGVL